jgi:spermidine/putrescine transport system permease protein
MILPRPHKLLLPFFIIMGLFFVLPLGLGLIYSFLKAAPYGGVIWEFSLEGYKRFLYVPDLRGMPVFDTGYLEIILGSVKLAAITTVLCIVIGFPTAWYMATRPPKQRDLWIVLITIPFWTNLLIRTYAWILILRTDGLANTVLQKTGIIDAPLQMLYNEFAVTLGLVYSYLPFMILPIYATLERMDWRLIEAAEDLYANKIRTLWHVILPLTIPGILAGSVLVFIPAIGSFLAADMLGGSKQMMLGNLIERQFFSSRNWPFGAAISAVVMATVLFGLMLIAKRGQGIKDALR